MSSCLARRRYESTRARPRFFLPVGTQCCRICASRRVPEGASRWRPASVRSRTTSGKNRLNSARSSLDAALSNAAGDGRRRLARAVPSSPLQQDPCSASTYRQSQLLSVATATTSPAVEALNKCSRPLTGWQVSLCNSVAKSLSVARKVSK